MISLKNSHSVDNMEAFDTIDMSYMGHPMPVGFLPHTDYLNTSSGMDMQDHLSNFETETYMR
jgi:hypothetical protein